MFGLGHGVGVIPSNPGPVSSPFLLVRRDWTKAVMVASLWDPRGSDSAEAGVAAERFLTLLRDRPASALV